MKLIKVLNLNKNYHTKTNEIKVLDNINLEIYDNEIVSIVGSSGCGKSTLLNILDDLDTPSSGKLIKIDNLVIGYMMQDDALLPWLTVYENAIIGLKLTNNINDESLKYVDYLLNKYNLIDFKSEYPDSLSGGMRQRLALIRTLATKPNILLLDEAFSKLDYKTRINITDDVYKIIKELKISAILITHDIKEAVSISDRIIILSNRPAKIIKEIIIDNNDDLPSKKNINNDLINSIMELIEDV